jgi:hypothetical protein
LKVGLYKAFIDLNEVLERGDSGKVENVTNASTTPVVATKQENAVGNPVPTQVVTEIKFSEKEEDVIKALLKKEEEKLKERLMLQEKRLREKMKVKVERQAKHSGMNLEVLQAIKEKKDELDKLKVECAERWKRIQVLKVEMKELRTPKPVKK